tara:strand:+ start:198464 stop:198736 length:273 start_codon:yes stop_codon:yes gene_type:complete
MSKPSAKMPLFISLGLVVVGLILGAVGGFASGSVVGGIIAGAGVIPAAWGAWAGMQGETQSGLAGAIGMVLLSLGVGGLLIVLGIIDWIR